MHDRISISIAYLDASASQTVSQIEILLQLLFCESFGVWLARWRLSFWLTWLRIRIDWGRDLQNRLPLESLAGLDAGGFRS